VNSEIAIFDRHAVRRENVAPTGLTLVPLLFTYWRMAVRRRWMILSIVAGAMVFGLVVTLLVTPKYTATATIEIARQQDKVTNVEGVTPETAGIDQEFYQTQYSLLRAQSLAGRVVRSLRLDAGTRLYDLYGIEPVEIARPIGRSATEHARLLREHRLRQLEDILLANLSIDPVRGSRLINVRFTSPEAAFSAQVANEWTRQFTDMTLDRRFQSTAAARQFLETRLEQLRLRLEQSERELVGYASNQRIINIQSNRDESGRTIGERSIIADDLQAINLALAAATAERVRAEARLREPGVSTSVSLNNDTVSGLRKRRADLAADYARALAQFEPEYPAVMALKSQLDALNRSLAQEEGRIGAGIQGEYREAVDRERQLREKVDNLKAQLLDQRRRSIQYNIFQREVDTNRSLYDGLLQRYKEIGVAGVGANNVSLVDQAATPVKPSSPNLLVNLLLSVLVGLLIAAVAVQVRELVEDAITDPQDLQDALALPTLGVIPNAGTESVIDLLTDRKSIASEAYMSMQTNLQFSSDHGTPRTLVVTSTRASEGKSTTAFATATQLARIGRSVILIDADMRSPSVHHLVGIKNTAGTSNFLSGQDDVAKLIQSTAISGMSVMVAGPIPPNAAELLTGKRMSLLLDSLLKQFDHVVVDAPPVLGLADSPLIASKVEATIYAVESNGAKARQIRSAIERLRAVNANIVGAVLTKYDANKARYGYGYDYGYSYGSAKDEPA